MGKQGDNENRVRSMQATMVLDKDQRGVDEAGNFRAIASSGVVDRHRTVIEPDAMRKAIPAFMEGGPRLLSQHGGGFLGSTRPSVIGSVREMRVDARGRTLFTGQYSQATEAGREWFGLARDGHPGPFSIGFIAEHHELRNHDELGGKSVVHYTQIDLLEISQVDTASNREAVMRDGQMLIDALIKQGGVKPDFNPLLELVQTRFDELRSETRQGLERVADDVVQRVVDRVVELLDTRDPYSRGIDDGERSRAGTGDDEPVGPEMDPQQLEATREVVERVARGG